MKIYLASPFFNAIERQNVETIATTLRRQGMEVYVPMEHDIPNGWDLPNHEWAEKVFQDDINAIQNSDKVVAIIYGMTDDAGTSWECGYAYGIGKPVELIKMGSEQKASLMVYGGSVTRPDEIYLS